MTADKTVAGFSNYGDLVDYCAPGSHITVATMDSGGAPAATTASGTSLSCPYGAACCALLLSLHPDLTLGQLNALLQGSAEDLGDLGFDPIYGNGLLRLDNLTQTGTTGNLTYTLTLPEGTLALTGTGDGADYDRAAATPWALWAEELQQITVADTVTGLGNFTFSGCQNAAFTLPETLQRLGAYVFENCKSLHTITLPRNVVQVGTGRLFRLQRSDSAGAGATLLHPGLRLRQGRRSYPWGACITMCVRFCGPQIRTRAA